MKTKLNLLAAGIFLAALSTGFGQPIIINQPQSQTNAVGTTATFWVEATNSAPLAYQWQKFVAANWSDLATRTNATLVFTNVQTSDAADYRVAITNVDGATNSDVAHLYVITPPRITPTITLQHQAVHVGTNASFAVTASGTAPLSYQWRLDGHDLSGQTSNKLTFSVVQPADEGDYTVVVTNVAGTVTSEPARLWVVPPASAFIKGNFTNQAGVRLPYFYLLPTNYTTTCRYPLLFTFHGLPNDETMITTPHYGYPGYANLPATKVFASYRQQEMDPMILLWPVRRAGDGYADWTFQYLQLASDLLGRFLSEVSIDTNRVYVAGYSQGVNAAWDLMGMRPGFFAGAAIGAGWQGVTPAAAIKDVPIWALCAQDDDAGQIGNTRSFVTALRRAGGNPIYTEFVSGGHLGGIFMGVCTPAFVNWILSQRRGVPGTAEPLVAITTPTVAAIYLTGMTNLNLAGFAAALGRDVTRVTWTNFANNAKGVATGSNLWSVTNIPLAARRTNVIAVVATTTSWAPAFGGNTTFNDILTVIQSPIRATLVLQDTQAILNWSGGGAPYRVQRATDLAVGDWTDFLTNVVPPVSLPLAGAAGFYRIVGQ